MSRFVDPFTDTGFKIIFGKENKSNEILKAFLNDLFEGQPDFDPVEKLHYLNNERSRESLEDRAILYDIVCETQSESIGLLWRCSVSRNLISSVARYITCQGLFMSRDLEELKEKKTNGITVYCR